MRPEDSYENLATCIALHGGGPRARAILAVHIVLCEDNMELAAEAGEWSLARDWAAESERAFVMLAGGIGNAIAERFSIDPDLEH